MQSIAITADEITNEDLAVRAKQGEKEAQLELWKRLERRTKFIATDIYRRHEKNFRKKCVSPEDLIQESYFAFVDAVRLFDPAKGFKFITYFNKAVKRRMYRVLKYKGKVDALDRRIDKDILYEDTEDETPVVDTLEDPSASMDFENVIDRVKNTQLHTQLEAAIQSLNSRRQRSVIRMYYFEGKTVKDCASSLSVSIQRINQIKQDALESLRKIVLDTPIIENRTARDRESQKGILVMDDLFLSRYLDIGDQIDTLAREVKRNRDEISRLQRVLGDAPETTELYESIISRSQKEIYELKAEQDRIAHLIWGESDQTMRNVLVRYYIQGDTLAYIAANMGYTTRHVSRIKARAVERAKLRMEMCDG